jgi:hypothetical protein
MGVSEQIQEALRQGRTHEEVLELLKAKGLSESNARKFIEAAAGRLRVQRICRRSPAQVRTLGRKAPSRLPDRDEEAGDGWTVQGAALLSLGIFGTSATYVSGDRAEVRALTADRVGPWRSSSA